MAQIAKHDSYAVDALGLRRVVRAGTQVPAGYTLVGAPAGEDVPQAPDQSASAPAGTTPAALPAGPQPAGRRSRRART